MSNGNFSLDSAKKRRKLYNHTQEPAFDDDADDPVINKSRESVSSILKKLEKEDEPTAAVAVKAPKQSVSLPPRPPLLPTPRDHSPPRRFPEMPSPLLSPLSALASSTSTLSLNLHKETQEVQPPTQSIVPSVLMEEDEIPSSQPQESKENSPVGPKLFPIFNRATQLSE